MATLSGTTVVAHPETGAPVVLLKDAEVPSWAAGLVGAHLIGDDAEGDTNPGGTPGAPPKNGAGSGAKAWREHADTLGVQTGDDATRDDVIAAVEAAGYPTE